MWTQEFHYIPEKYVIEKKVYQTSFDRKIILLIHIHGIASSFITTRLSKALPRCLGFMPIIIIHNNMMMVSG